MPRIFVSVTRAVAFVLALTLCAGPARAQGKDRGLLWGGGPKTERPKPELDPHLPTGPQILAQIARPQTSVPPACSFKRPVCVHRSGGGGPNDSGASGDQRALGWLTALEAAYESVVLSLGAPAPLADRDAGGGPQLDLYLQPGSGDVQVGVDPTLGLGWDRGAAYCVAGTERAASPRSATLCVGEAVAARLDPAEGAHFRRALAQQLWWITGDPASADYAAIDAFQSHPELSPLRRDPHGTFSAGAAAFLEYLDGIHGVGAPARLPLTVAALAGGSTKADPRYDNEPDVADVLRSTFGRGNPTAYARFWSDFAVARAFLGSRSDGRLRELDWAGDAGRVRFDWSVKLSSLPRHLASPQPLEPLGSAYVYLDLDAPLEGKTIAFKAQWEAPVAFKWTLVAVDGAGRELSRIDVPYLERATTVERTLVNLAGAKGVIVVGTNLGDLSPTFPFDPDHEPWEGHGWLVYLVGV